MLPSGGRGDRYRVHSVVKVIGRAEGHPEGKEYLPFECLGPLYQGSPVYEVTRSSSPIDGLPEVFLSFPYARAAPELQMETLSVELICTNGRIAERLGAGDIQGETSGLSGPLLFRNVIQPTLAVDPPLGKRALWKLLGHLSLNYLPLADASNLKEMLMLYAFPGTRGSRRRNDESKADRGNHRRLDETGEKARTRRSGARAVDRGSRPGATTLPASAPSISSARSSITSLPCIALCIPSHIFTSENLRQETHSRGRNGWEADHSSKRAAPLRGALLFLCSGLPASCAWSSLGPLSRDGSGEREDLSQPAPSYRLTRLKPRSSRFPWRCCPGKKDTLSPRLFRAFT